MLHFSSIPEPSVVEPVAVMTGAGTVTVRLAGEAGQVGWPPPSARFQVFGERGPGRRRGGGGFHAPRLHSLRLTKPSRLTPTIEVEVWPFRRHPTCLRLRPSPPRRGPPGRRRAAPPGAAPKRRPSAG